MAKKFLLIALLLFIFFALFYFLVFYQQKKQETQSISFVDKTKASGWGYAWKSRSTPYEATLLVKDITFNLYIFDLTNDKKINYDTIIVSLDKKEVLVTLKLGVWSNWRPVEHDNYVKFKLIELSDKGVFRIRVLSNNFKEYPLDPSSVSLELPDKNGSMIDFVDRLASFN